MAKPRTFTRLTVPSVAPDAQAAFSDVYDKLAQLSTNDNSAFLKQLEAIKDQISKLEQTKATGQISGGGSGGSVGPVIPAKSIQGATGRAADPQLPYLAALADLPDDAVYARDGVLIEYTPDPTIQGLLYRYDGGTAEWIGPMLGVAIIGTHADRLTNWLPATLDVGAMYYETDRTVLYVVTLNGPNLVWTYATGLYESTGPNQPDDLGVDDAGFRFKNETLQFTYRWSGTAWQLELELGTAVTTVHTDRTANGTATTVEISGIVNTSGLSVSWVSGEQFDNVTGYWPGKTININLVDYVIDNVASPTSMTILTSAGVQGAVVYYAQFGKADNVTGNDFEERWVGYRINLDGIIYTIAFVDYTLQVMYLEEITPNAVGIDWWLIQLSSVLYRNGVTLYETDRKITYVAGNATGLLDTATITGVVDTNLVGVTRIGGDPFQTNGTWTGLPIVIDGSNYVIDTVIDIDNLVLTASAGIAVGVAYSMPTVFEVTFLADADPGWVVGTEIIIDGSDCVISGMVSLTSGFVIGSVSIGAALPYVVPSGAWIYQTGIYCDDWIDMPTDLGVYDGGFLFTSLDYCHTHRWTGATWTFAVGDSGSGYIVDALAPPNGGVTAWQACDGSAVDVMLGDGTTVLVTTPSWNGSNAFEQATGTNLPGVYTNPIRAKWETGARTDDNNTGHTHEVSHGSVEVQSGTGSDVGSEGDNNTGPESNTHYHELTDANAQLQEPGEVGGSVPARMAFEKYLRR